MFHNLIKLARPKQWSKSVFVLIGPLYGFAAGQTIDWRSVAFAIVSFALASSGCYIINDIRDAEADRAHPRKRSRPIASGAVSPKAGVTFAILLFALAGVAATFGVSPAVALPTCLWLVFYVLNVSLYSIGLKRVVVLDVISLASGFVLRVLAGCAAAGVEPSTWLLNSTLFVSMFLAFGKRLGERRTMGADVAAVRAVQSAYTDDLLRMVVVVTGVACLVTYAGYVQAQAERYTSHIFGAWGFNLLWMTVLPATYGLLRCIVQVERGIYDDPTELASKDRPFQAAVALFVALTLLAIWASHHRA
ncbi:MAG: UbiA prenyltransferase family protein [Phycisphaerales bacterium]|nr:UbiA prenyltransferase family protein [Phycisphaerales bacterium]